MTQLTVFDSFHRSLPPFPIAPEADNYRRISPSSKSTKEQKPLRTWIQETYMVLLENAERFLLDDESKARGVLSKYSSLITNTYILRTEADVLGASVLHLFHDINITLNEGLRHGTIRTEHEESKKSGRIRTDVSWAFYPHQGQPQEIAVLELKAPSILTWEDFAGAVARNYEEKKDKLRRTEGPGHITLLVRKAKCCIQQLMKYAKSLNIKDVALFD